MSEKQSAMYVDDEDGVNVKSIVKTNPVNQASSSTHMLRKINDGSANATKPNISTGCDSALVACV